MSSGPYGPIFLGLFSFRLNTIARSTNQISRLHRQSLKLVVSRCQGEILMLHHLLGTHLKFNKINTKENDFLQYSFENYNNLTVNRYDTCSEKIVEFYTIVITYL